MLHNLPIVWDIRAQYPDAKIDWLVEEAYVSLLTPLLSRTLADGTQFKGLDGIIPIAMRRWKKAPLSAQTRQEWQSFKQQLQSTRYDLIIETQGLLKAAWLTRLALRSAQAPIVGLANATLDSGFEPSVRWFYTERVQVPLHCHAVDRSRWVAAGAMNIAVPDKNDTPPQFYPASCVQQWQQSPALFKQPYALFFHATARAAKAWPESHWVSLGRSLSAQGLHIVLPWGNAHEKNISQHLSQQIPNTEVAPAIGIQDWFHIIANASLVVGVDTGLTHLSAMMCKPTIELYCDSPRWKTQGYWSSNLVNLGDTGIPPSVEEVTQALSGLSLT